jgi:hypothetical protein
MLKFPLRIKLPSSIQVTEEELIKLRKNNLHLSIELNKSRELLITPYVDEFLKADF